MKRFAALFLSIALSTSLFGATAKLQIDTKTHVLTADDGSTIIDAKGVNLTVGGFTISDASGRKTIVTGSVSGTTFGDTGNKIGFLGATPIVRPTGNIFTALANYGLVASPSLAIADVTSLQTALDAKADVAALNDFLSDIDADIATKADAAATTSSIATKADDSVVVHKTGNETAAGNKTFSGTTVLDATTARGVAITGLSTPSAPTVTGTGNVGVTTWSYKVVAKLSNGLTSAASAAGSNTSGYPTLSGSNYNTITWSAVTGATSYDVYRTAAGTSPSTTGKIATGLTVTTLNDQGAAGDSSTPPSVNSTGAITAESGTISGTLTGNSGTFSGNVTAPNIEVTAKSLGATGDGSTDDYAVLNTYLSAGNRTVRFTAPGTYMLGSTVGLGSHTRVIIDAGATVKALAPHTASVLLFSANNTGLTDIVIEGPGTLDGNASNVTGENLLQFIETSNLTIKNLTIQNVKGITLYMSTNMVNVKITDNRFSNTGNPNGPTSSPLNSTISLNETVPGNSRQITISRNSFENYGLAATAIENTTGLVFHGNTARYGSDGMLYTFGYNVSVSVVGNEGDGGSIVYPPYANGLDLTGIHGGSVAGNTMTNFSGTGILLSGCTDVSISGGSFLNNHSGGSSSSFNAGITIGGSTGITVSGVRAGDTQTPKTQRTGLLIATDSTVTETGNDFTGNSTYEVAYAPPDDITSVNSSYKSTVVPLTLTNSWVNFGSGLETAGVQRIGRTVVLSGIIKDGNAAYPTLITTLPSRYRPLATKYFKVANDTGQGIITVQPNGDVQVNNVSNTFLSLAGVTFIADPP